MRSFSEQVGGRGRQRWSGFDKKLSLSGLTSTDSLDPRIGERGAVDRPRRDGILTGTHSADFVPCFAAFETNVRPYADLVVMAIRDPGAVIRVFAKECWWVFFLNRLLGLTA